MQPLYKIWMDGELVPWDEARVHVLTHSLHYGLAVFEGIRCYATPRGSAVFRLKEHVDRLFDSAHIAAMHIPYDRPVLSGAILDTVRANRVPACYIRPLIYFGYGRMGIDNRKCPVNVCIAAWGWGAYLGEDAEAQGIRVRVSSYTRNHVNINMTHAKITGNYANSQMAKREAVDDGYHEALMLDPDGFVAEGTGENIFAYRGGVVRTPPIQGILPGITRDAVLRIVRDMGVPVSEERLSRDEIYCSDEIFLTGTAAEITPVREVDRRKIGAGRPGDLTRRVQEVFRAATMGEDARYTAWNTYLAPDGKSVENVSGPARDTAPHGTPQDVGSPQRLSPEAPAAPRQSRERVPHVPRSARDIGDDRHASAPHCS
ncbi:MAG: branched-chain amino acid transaminase [Planctomycetes bacterium]|nr:branched-chain amino acid transaminase [Planctomycetota bacterium]